MLTGGLPHSASDTTNLPTSGSNRTPTPPGCMAPNLERSYTIESIMTQRSPCLLCYMIIHASHSISSWSLNKRSVRDEGESTLATSSLVSSFNSFCGSCVLISGGCVSGCVSDSIRNELLDREQKLLGMDVVLWMASAVIRPPVIHSCRVWDVMASCRRSRTTYYCCR